jgi:hypothetical protein
VLRTVYLDPVNDGNRKILADVGNTESLDFAPHPAHDVVRNYLAGTLGGEDRLRLVEHLRDCEACRGRLEELRNRHVPLAGEPASPVTNEPLPTAQSTAAARAGVAPAGGRTAAAGAAADGLRLPAWLVACLLLTVLVESAALLRGVWNRTDAPTSRPASALAPEPAQAQRIRVVFLGSASEQAIRALLRTVRGRIVDGPSPDGGYVVEIRPDHTPGGDTALQILRNRIDLVKQVGAGPTP